MYSCSSLTRYNFQPNRGIHMQYIISIFFLLTTLVYSESNTNKAKLMMVLESWNDANNANDIDTLSRLYASKITYYGSKLSRQKCIKDKKRLFKKYPYFSQSIQNAAYISLHSKLHKVIFDKYVRISPNKS